MSVYYIVKESSIVHGISINTGKAEKLELIFSLKRYSSVLQMLLLRIERQISDMHRVQMSSRVEKEQFNNPDIIVIVLEVNDFCGVQSREQIIRSSRRLSPCALLCCPHHGMRVT